MAEISRFFGIIIYMYGNDYNPPHFHVKYAENLAMIDIKTGILLEGKLLAGREPVRFNASGLVLR